MTDLPRFADLRNGGNLPRRTSGLLGKAIIAAGIIAMFLLIAPKAMTQAAYDAAQPTHCFTEGC